MICPNRRYRKWVDPVSNEIRYGYYPCGRPDCTACLHNTQDSWAIRINESVKRSPRHEFIYDTLTFAPVNIPKVEISSSDFHGASSDSQKYIDYFSRQITRKTGEIGYFVPVVERQIIREWIRRGREAFRYVHGYRANWKYFICMEYGPATSRPHLHLIFIGISHGDYVKYLAKPWRRDFGFTKTKCVKNDTKKDRQCISRYISKYVSKGVFESPLVTDGLCPRPFRCISHGIGEEFLTSRPEFLEFQSYVAQVMKKYTVEKGVETGALARSERTRRALRLGVFDDSFVEPSSLALDSLVRYVDESSYCHSLPRYYKAKLLNLFTPNLYAYKVQNLLLARADRDHNQKLATFARCMGRRAFADSPLLGLSRFDYNLVCSRFVVAEISKAKDECRRRFVKLKNHYSRPLRAPIPALVA